MISAVEALRLPGARLTEADRRQLREVLGEIDRHVRATMTFSGPSPMQIPVKRMSKVVATAVVVTLQRQKWQTVLRMAGPETWEASFAPTHDAFAEAGAIEVAASEDHLSGRDLPS